MCAICSALNVPICATGVVCSANLHEVISFALLSGSGLVGSIFGFLRINKDEYDKKK